MENMPRQSASRCPPAYRTREAMPFPQSRFTHAKLAIIVPNFGPDPASLRTLKFICRLRPERTREQRQKRGPSDRFELCACSTHCDAP